MITGMKMSRQSRAEAAAKAMIEASQDAAIIIEACENKHRLNKSEANDVLCGCVMNFLTRDGEADKKTVTKRVLELGDQLVDYVRDAFGFDITEDDSDEAS